MGPKLEFTLTDRQLAITFCEENNAEENFMSVYNNWKLFINDFTLLILLDREALVHVYSPDGKFEFPQLENAQISSEILHDVTYCKAYSNIWNKSDLLKITPLMEFELSTLWFQFTEKFNSDNQISSEVFFNSANQVAANGDCNEFNFEFYGCIADCHTIIWQNLNKEVLDAKLANMKELCDSHGFECIMETGS